MSKTSSAVNSLPKMSRSTRFFLVRMTNWKSSWCKTFDKFHVWEEDDGDDDDSSSNALCWNGKRSFEERGWQRPQQFEEHQRRRGMDRKLAMDDAPQNFGWILLLTKVPKIHPIWYSHPSLSLMLPSSTWGSWVPGESVKICHHQQADPTHTFKPVPRLQILNHTHLFRINSSSSSSHHYCHQSHHTYHRHEC